MAEDTAAKNDRVTKSEIAAGLRGLGLGRGDVVLVHSSLSRFGYVEGGAAAVGEAIMEVLGEEGTVMMSAITTSKEFVIACIGAAERGEVAPVDFNVAEAKTHAGAIAETFRLRGDVVRSWHPTHSVSAWGRKAEAMVKGHEQAPGPCGEGTPYARVCEEDRGSILLLGVSHMANTTLHGMEEMAGCAYVNWPGWVSVPVVTRGGRVEARTRVHVPFMQRNLNVYESDYIDGMAERVGWIGKSYVRLLSARRMKELTMSRLRQDPLGMLNGKGRLAWERMKASGVFTRDPLSAEERNG